MTQRDKDMVEEALHALFGEDDEDDTPSVAMPRERPRLLMAVDSSTSMHGLRDVTVMAVDSFNATLASQVPHCRATLVLFDTAVGAPLYNDVALPTVRSIEKEYNPYGGTALYDAIVSLIREAERSYPNDSVVLAFQTDGEDMNSTNSVHDATQAIRKAKERGWQVVFIGAAYGEHNQDNLAKIAHRMGIDPALLLTYNPASSKETFEGMAENIASWMEGKGDAGFTEAQRRLAGEIRKHTKSLTHETKRLTDGRDRRLLTQG